jgi:lambda family phage portal protein
MWPFNKKQKPQKRQYAGAHYGRLVSDWIAQSTSIDSEIRGSIKLLRNRTRQLERDNDFIRAYLREVEINSIGQGVQMQAQVKMQRGEKLNDKANTQIEQAWCDWHKKSRCHTAGKLSFQQIERLVVRSVARDGEICIRLIKQKFGDSKVPLALEVIEADRLDDNYNDQLDNGNIVKMGVEFDQWQRPVAYHFFSAHPGDYPAVSFDKSQTRHRVRIPADEIIHCFMSERAGQTRGVPWLSSAIMRLHHLQGYEEAEVISARANASVMGFIQSPEAELQGDGVVDNERVSDFSPGMFKYLAPGESIHVPDTSRPNANFEMFMKSMLRSTAAGVGVSYEAISKDFASGNFSNSRLSLLNDRDHWRVIQQWIIDQFHQVVFEAWLDLAVLSGVLNFPDYETNPDRYQGVRWKPRGWAWVDPQKEVAAYREAIRGGLTSISKVVAGQGEDVEELFTEIARERELAKSLDILFDTDAGLPLMSNAGPGDAAESAKTELQN